MCHEESIHEVIAFPKNTLAASPMDECPSPVDQSQLDDLHINVYDPEE
jgi:aspartyl-tRNA synthetase